PDLPCPDGPRRAPARPEPRLLRPDRGGQGPGQPAHRGDDAALRSEGTDAMTMVEPVPAGDTYAVDGPQYVLPGQPRFLLPPGWDTTGRYTNRGPVLLTEMTPDEVAELQYSLQGTGFYDGPINGQLD